jgi:hypothetical protein
MVDIESSYTIVLRIEPGWRPGHGEIQIAPEHKDDLTACLNEVGVPNSPVVKLSQVPQILATIGISATGAAAVWKALPSVLEKFWHRHDCKSATLKINVTGQPEVEVKGYSASATKQIFEKVADAAQHIQTAQEQRWFEAHGDESSPAPEVSDQPDAVEESGADRPAWASHG